MFRQRPDGHTFLCKFRHFQIAVSCLLLQGLFTPNLGICKAWSALYDFYNCQLFLSKMGEIFRLHRTWISEDLPTASGNCRSFGRLPKIAEDFTMTSENNQRCRKIFDDFKTGRANDLQMITNQSWALLKSSEDVLTSSRTFSTNYSLYCQLGVRNWSECVRSQV